jgi:lipopolysaccharide export LptBFGC system permease protein LptF
MKLLDRYLVREMVVPFLIGQAAIVLMLTGTVLYNNAELFLANQIPVADVARLVLYFLPFLVHMTMPVAMAVAASLAISRLGRDSEITVMRSAGVSLIRIFLPIFLTGLIVSGADFYFGEYVVPAAMTQFNAVRAEIPMHLKRLMPATGQYIISSDQSFALFVQSMVPQPGYIALNGIQIISSPKVTMSGQSNPSIIAARHGRYENGDWILDDAFILSYSLDGKTVTMGPPKRITIYIPVDPQAFQSSFLMQMPMGTMANSATRTFAQLGHDLKIERSQGIHDLYALLDYHFKLSVPFSCLVMALCCPPLALRFGRGGGFMGVLLSICLVFVYWNTLLLARILGSPGPEGSAPLLWPPLAAWSQNVLFVLLGLFVLRKSE